MHFYQRLQYGWVRDAFLNYRCLNESSTYRRDVDVLSTRFRWVVLVNPIHHACQPRTQERPQSPPQH